MADAKQLLRRAGHEAKVAALAASRPVRRVLRDPWRDGAEKPLLLHCCHHKTGTVWFINVLNAVAVHYGYRFQDLQGRLPEPGVRLAVQHDSQIDLDRLPAGFAGSHMIRDPRDVVVSAYFFHLWTTEAWAHEPDPAYGGRSYQEHLKALDRHDGLAEEIRHSLPVIEQMTRWRYDDPRFLELRYEDAMDDEEAAFTALFRHYGFHEEAVRRCIGIAAKYSFANVAKRRVGEKREGSHLRSGRSGQWSDVFDDDHVRLFKEVAGDSVITLGYEKGADW